MLVRLNSETDALIETQVMIFKNADHNYVFNGIFNNEPFVAYETDPKG